MNAYHLSEDTAYYVKIQSAKTKWMTIIIFSLDEAIFQDRFGIEMHFDNNSSDKCNLVI